jgi:hypothetical protein
MSRKRKIFIGCSQKEIERAQLAKGLLSNDFEVTIWNDSIWETDTPAFKLNDNILQGLLRASLQFDFAVMIGTTDDKVEKKGEVVMQARDNVLFELGLFIGRVGLRRCAFIVDRELDIMEDFKGIVRFSFDSADVDSFRESVRKVKRFFKQAKDWSINVFPSATLASAYFENLIRPTYEYLIGNRGLEIDEKKRNDWKFKIIIPKTLSSDINVQFQAHRIGRELRDLKIATPGRPRTIVLETDIVNGIPLIVDFPTVLSGIDHAIKHLLPDEYNEASDDYKDILERELERFQTALLSYAERYSSGLAKRITFETTN